jgi:membrane associated rhomboid family serine protease
MTAAPVGFQCPECLADGRKSVRQAKTPFGGEIRENGNVVTKALIGTNVVAWLLGMLIGNGSLSQQLFLASRGGLQWDEMTARFGLVLGNADSFQIGVHDGEWYRLITAAFLHASVAHILLNMLALWFIGSALEPVLGRWRFASLYVLAALGGSAASLLSGFDYQLSVGASGAVYGLFGALFIVMRRLGRDVTFVVVLLVINLIFGFTVPGIDWRAHLGGLVVGTGLAYVFAHAPKQHRTAWGVTACAVALVATMTVVAAVAL